MAFVPGSRPSLRLRLERAFCPPVMAFQPFNLSVLTWALIAQAVQGVLTEEVRTLTLVCLPGTLLGTWIGIRSYGRVNDRQFRIIVLWLLFASGATLTLSNAF